MSRSRGKQMYFCSERAAVMEKGVGGQKKILANGVEDAPQSLVMAYGFFPLPPFDKQ